MALLKNRTIFWVSTALLLMLSATPDSPGSPWQDGPLAGFSGGHGNPQGPAAMQDTPAAPPVPPQGEEQPPPQPPSAGQPGDSFQPSEKIKADQAVDFPYDI